MLQSALALEYNEVAVSPVMFAPNHNDFLLPERQVPSLIQLTAPVDLKLEYYCSRLVKCNHFLHQVILIILINTLVESELLLLLQLLLIVLRGVVLLSDYILC